MKAIVCSSYGRPDVLELAEVEKPALADDLVLVKVRAASVNPADWYGVAGPLIVRPSTGWFKPRSDRTGVDFAGTVEAVGKDVTHVGPGDDVFGARSGALAEYVTVRDAVVAKPANITFEEAAAVPVAAITALQGLRDKGQLQAGQRVLINGASGGVGTFAVQIAKALGAEVTAVCSTRNVELARSLGADHVVDYTREDFTRSDRRYDLLLDVAGGKSWSQLRRVLTPDATVVIVGAQKRRVFGPDRPHRPAAGVVAAARQPEGRVLHRQDEQGRHGDPARAARDREGEARGRPEVRAGRHRRRVPLPRRRPRPRQDRRHGLVGSGET